MDRRVVICVGVGERYEPYARRLHRTVDQFWDGPTLFYKGVYPPGSPTHEQQNYGFKAYAIREAVRLGYTCLLYTDACVVASGPIAPLFDHIQKDGYVLIEDSHKIRDWTSDAVLAWAGVSRAQIPPTQTSAAGGFVGMDLEHAVGRFIYEKWLDAVDKKITQVYWRADEPLPPRSLGAPGPRATSIAMHGGAHISDDPTVLGSLGDEAVLGVLAFKHGFKAQPGNNPWCSQFWNGAFQSTGYDGKFDVVDHATVVPELISPGGFVLDVGSRGLVFAREMARRGCRVIAMDPEPVPPGTEIPGITLLEAALVGIGKGGRYPFASWDNGEGDHLVMPGLPAPPERASVREVLAMDIREVMARYGVTRWDCIKMNCEGSEFDVLGTLPGPIARQLTVSFHDHTGANPGGKEAHNKLLGYVEQWYFALRHIWEDRYSAGFSYWDSVFTLRDKFR